MKLYSLRNSYDPVSSAFSAHILPGKKVAIRWLIVLLLGLAHGWAAADEAMHFSVIELPALEGETSAQIAVKWSGELPARLQAGHEDEYGRFVAQGIAMRLSESMSLLPLPSDIGLGALSWKLLDADGRVLARQRSGSTEPGWQPGFFASPGIGTFPGSSSSISSMIEFQGDLIVAGSFQNIGDLFVDGLARWDGTSWSALNSPAGTGVTWATRAITSLAVYDGALIVGGRFRETEGSPTVSTLLRWDGVAWSTLSGLALPAYQSGSIYSLTVYQGDLFVGGTFSRLDGVEVNAVARWDGNAWSPLSGPPSLGGFASVNAMIVYDNELILAGDFTLAGGLTANRVVRWDGATWSNLSGLLGEGTDWTVRTLTVYDGALILGGDFTHAGGVLVNRVARWDGSDWSALSGPSGTGVVGLVKTLAVYDGSLIVGGSFNQAGGISVGKMARWDGAQWSALSAASGTGMDKDVRSLLVYDGALVAGGDFALADGRAVNHVALWRGNAWSALDGPSGAGMNGAVVALHQHNGEMVAAGAFTQAGGIVVNGVASWNGASWSALSGPLGTGIENLGFNEIRATTVYDGALIVGGRFATAGGVTVNNLARWDGTNWSALSGPSGTGVSIRVHSLTVYDGALIVGGWISQAGGLPMSNIARWDGTAWSALVATSGAALTGMVDALTVYDGSLIAAGTFTTAGGALMNRIARWDGANWLPLSGPEGVGVNGAIRALTVYDDALIVGGSFSTAGGVLARGVARWDGTSWSPLRSPPGGLNAYWVDGFALYDGTLVASGNFRTFDNATVASVSRWDGVSWSGMLAPDGGSISVVSFAVFDDALFAGGWFNHVEGVVSSYIAQYRAGYTIGGTVAGLAGSGLVLQNNGLGDLFISENGAFEFETEFVIGSPYDVTVLTEPDSPNQTCLVSNGDGTVNAGNVTGVVVTCLDLSVEVQPAQLDFGDVNMGSISEVMTVLVENTGQAPVEVNAVNVIGPASSEYLVLTETCTAEALQATQLCGIELVFEPARLGVREAQLMIAVDRFDQAFSVELNGLSDAIWSNGFEAQE